MERSETIAAVATPPGRGGVGIVRVSGPAVAAVARGVLGDLPPARRAVLRSFRDAGGGTIDTGIALLFPGPGSYTGEDVLELQGHGGPVVQALLLERCLELGARRARPGEFTERAFLNGRLDLAQAEAVADLIDSASAAAARAAARSLEGRFSAEIRELDRRLLDLRARLEGDLDFPDEGEDFLAAGGVNEGLAALAADLDRLLHRARQGRLLRDGLHVVIAGPPNAGKSSLLNALAGANAAIVTGVPGTTRDLLRERIVLQGIPVELVDTAGLRETDDEVERIGVERAWEAAAHADRILLVVDDRRGVDADGEAILQRLHAVRDRVTLVRNKIDLTGRRAGTCTQDPAPCLALSAATGAGLDALRAHLLAAAGAGAGGDGDFSARQRHLEALARAAEHLQCARRQLAEPGALELAAEDLRLAHRAFGDILGHTTTEDLLGHIFASFCIGK